MLKLNKTQFMIPSHYFLDIDLRDNGNYPTYSKQLVFVCVCVCNLYYGVCSMTESLGGGVPT